MTEAKYAVTDYGVLEPGVYLDSVGAAGILRISARTLQRHRLTGTGPRYAKAGRRVLYRRDWLEDWLEQRSFTSTSAARARGIR